MREGMTGKGEMKKLEWNGIKGRKDKGREGMVRRRGYM